MPSYFGDREQGYAYLSIFIHRPTRWTAWRFKRRKYQLSTSWEFGPVRVAVGHE